MSRLNKAKKITQSELREQAWGASVDWRWHLNRSQLVPPCPRANRSNRHFLQLTGVAEWEMSSGAECRSIAWRCPVHGDTWEIRSVKRDHYSGWCEPFVLHNGEYAGNLDGHKLGFDNDTSD